jgi:MipA family protein
MRRLILPAIGLIVFSQTALAQETSPPELSADPTQAGTPAEADVVLQSSVFDGDFLVVGVGAVSMPSYEGSNDRAISPIGGVFGRIGGVGVNPRAAGLALDFAPADQGRVAFGFGPLARWRGNRNGNVRDPVVAALGKRDAVIEGGLAMSVTVKGLLNAFDRISVGTDVRWDISGKGSGRVIAPGATYFTPVSKGQVVGARLGAEFVDHKYATYNYAIDAEESAASGLAPYSARGGFKEWNLGAFTAVDLSGNFLDGGFAIGGGVQYSRLQGSGAETPITSVRGKRGQWFFGAGLGYTF